MEQLKTAKQPEISTLHRRASNIYGGKCTGRGRGSCEKRDGVGGWPNTTDSGSLYTKTVQQTRDYAARRPVRKLQCAGLPCGYELLFSGEPIWECGGNLIPHGGRGGYGHITYQNGAWWPSGSKTSSTTPSPRHERIANLAYDIRLVAAPYAAQYPHLPQFPRDPGVCNYTPSTDAPAT